MNIFENIKLQIDEYTNTQSLNSVKSSMFDVSKYCLNIINGILFNNKDYDNSIKLSKTLIQLSEIEGISNPEIYSNLVYLLHKTSQNEEATQIAHKAIYELDIISFDLLYNYAIALKNLIRYKEAVEIFRLAEKLNPSFPMLHYQLANILLAMGNYKEGLIEDEYRFLAHSGLKKFRKRFLFPDWTGQDNAKILLFSEQGLGDAFQNARYIKHLKEKNNYITLEVQKELYSLFLVHPYLDQVLPREAVDLEEPEFEEHDYVLSINSLPYWFDPEYNKTPIEPYLISNKYVPKKYDFSPYKDKKKIGIVWAGNCFHLEDRNRSCFLKAFEPLVDIPNSQLFSLQTGKQVRTWTKNNELLFEGEDYDIVNLIDGCDDFIPKIIDLMNYAGDFNDTALFLDDLDAVVTVDTAVAHLAGAMGKKVCLLLSHQYEWRWAKQWYPNMKLFIQKSPGDWDSAIKEVCNELSNI